MALVTEIRKELSGARQQAATDWQAFKEFRDDAGEEKLQKDAETFDKADELHRIFAESSQKVAELEGKLWKAMDWDGATPPDVEDPKKTPSERKFWTPGQRVVETEAYKELLESGDLQRKSAGAGDFKWSAGIVTSREEFKALITGASDTSAGAFVDPDRVGYFPLLLRPLTIRDLVTVGDTDSDVVEWVKENSFTNAAAETAEATATAGTSGTKPESALDYAIIQSNVRNIAHWIPATKRALADAGQLRTLIDARLEDGVQLRLDTQMISGDATGENLRGILNVSGVQSQDGTAMSSVEALLRAITKIRLAFIEPTAIVMHPNDFLAMRLATNASGDYYFGPPNIAGPMQAWGVPIVLSTVIAENTALVGKWNEAMLWVREGITVTSSDSHSDFFVRNMVAVLAEGRFAFGLPRPAAFCQVINV